mgnify:CR=1 FL=1
MFDFEENEWQTFSHTEKAIIILARKHNVKTHESMRHWLNWPLPGQMHKRTYEGHWQRLQKKMRAITSCRKKAARLQLTHGTSESDPGGTREGNRMGGIG